MNITSPLPGRIEPARTAILSRRTQLRIRRALLTALVYLVILGLLSPIVTVAASAFTATNFAVFPPVGLSLKWFQAAAASRDFTSAFSNSLLLALVNAVLATSLGTLSALGIVRYRFRGRDLATTFLLSPLMLPAIVLGVAVLQFLASSGLLGTPEGVLVGHLLVTIPYAVRLVAVSLGGFDWHLEQAALGLGATPVVAFRRIVVPIIRPGLAAAATFSFILSFDEVTISIFTTGPRLVTLPVAIFRWVEFSYEPIIAAACTIVVAITAVAVVIIDRAVGLERCFGQAGRA